MPYITNADLPSHVKKYSMNIRRQFMHVFNTVFADTKSEARAFKAANSILKKRFTKGQNISKESHSDYFTHLVDKFTGNLEG